MDLVARGADPSRDLWSVDVEGLWLADDVILGELMPAEPIPAARLRLLEHGVRHGRRRPPRRQARPAALVVGGLLHAPPLAGAAVRRLAWGGSLWEAFLRYLVAGACTLGALALLAMLGALARETWRTRAQPAQRLGRWALGLVAGLILAFRCA